MILDKFKLDGKIALVTGASVGLGQGMALALAEAGADVACHCLNAGEADETVAKIEALGQRAVSIPGDMSDKETPKRVVADVVAAFGRIDILINNKSQAWLSLHNTILNGYTTHCCISNSWLQT
ncbi:MAG: SDR family NAD(P)-dependent oxidoreductase [Saprospiraceae bacterium]|nr:SDR family NAD(P)-dependent oxidoreductase [Saprospiraceae bacterium]